MSRILSTLAPWFSLFALLGTFASAGDAIFLPLLLRLLMPCRVDARLLVLGTEGHYYETAVPGNIRGAPEGGTKRVVPTGVPERGIELEEGLAEHCGDGSAPVSSQRGTVCDPFWRHK